MSEEKKAETDQDDILAELQAELNGTRDDTVATGDGDKTVAASSKLEVSDSHSFLVLLRALAKGLSILF